MTMTAADPGRDIRNFSCNAHGATHQKDCTTNQAADVHTFVSPRSHASNPLFYIKAAGTGTTSRASPQTSKGACAVHQPHLLHQFACTWLRNVHALLRWHKRLQCNIRMSPVQPTVVSSRCIVYSIVFFLFSDTRICTGHFGPHCTEFATCV